MWINVGFLLKRQWKYNIRIVWDILDYLKQHNEKQGPLIFLDAGKIFDNLNLTFLCEVLED